MDRDDKMMNHHFVEVEANAAADEDEHLTILAYLIQL
jgi:hypothetical protein